MTERKCGCKQTDSDLQERNWWEIIFLTSPSSLFSNNIWENISWILVFAAWCWLLHSILLKQEAAFHISVSVKRRVMDITFLFPETGSQYNLAVYVFSCDICVNFQSCGLYSPFHTLQSLNDSSPLRFHIIVFFLLSR